MKNLTKELRRREVFRTAGLYIGGVWLLLQIIQFFLRVYEQPDWIMKALIPIAIAGLPIVIALAWVFDITPSGIKIDKGDAESDGETGPHVQVTRARKNDFIVIGLLLVALGGSLFINFTPRVPAMLQALDPVSILISNFNNTTGDTVFDGALEQALTIAIEESPFITAFDRKSASRALTAIDENANTLDAAAARLVSAREGIRIVIDGNLEQNNGKYEVSVFAVDVGSGEELANFSEKANSKSDVLGVVGSLAKSLRKKLGDVNVDKTNGEETFTTTSLEAMHDYVIAQDLTRDGDNEQALTLYQSAVDKDPAFGRAWTGMAVSANKLGKTDVAEAAWPKVLDLLDGMTERERYRTLGVYYALVTKNTQKTIENYIALVEKFPADAVGLNNLAVAHFLNLEFAKALEVGSKVVKIYPTRAAFHANYSLYAMYASDFETALIAADKTVELKPDYYFAYLPYAVDALVKNNPEVARAAYVKMAEASGAGGTSLANIGIADLEIWTKNYAAAIATLQAGISVDETSGNNGAVSTKKMILAYAMLQGGQESEKIIAEIDAALEISSSTSRQVPAALMYISMSKDDLAIEIANSLEGNLNAQQRAYAKMINAVIATKNGDNIAAVEGLQEALNLADLWLVRFYLGKAYASAGYYTEAFSEFTACKERLGEAYSLFLDDTPTFRYTSGLDDLLNDTKKKMTSLLASSQ